MGSDSPKPDPDGHSRGLPQSFTRSQKERPLGKYIVAPPRPPLVAIILRSRDEFETGVFLYFPAPFGLRAGLKAASGTDKSKVAARTCSTVSPTADQLVMRRNATITPSTGR